VYLLLLVGGAIVVPLSRHPEGLQPYLELLPSTALAQALRSLSAGDAAPAGAVLVLAGVDGAGHAGGGEDVPMGVTVQESPSRRGRLGDPPSDRTLRRVAIASLVANVGIVATGGAVRLTGSGLGCPTWPRCTDESYVAHGELGFHGAIEFGNRLLTFALAAIAAITLIVVWRARPTVSLRRRLALALAVGVPAQAVIGGLTVLADLNPWIVAGHLLLSMAMIALAVVLLHDLKLPPTATLTQPPAPAPRALRVLGLVIYAVTWLVLYLGTVVTGSGPHAGDAASPRNGLDPAAMSQLHADGVFLLVGLTVGAVFAARVAGRPTTARAASWLLAVELAQGVIGFVQYATNLPILLVELHLLGACATVAAATALLLSVPRPGAAAQPTRGSMATARNSSAR
jgi:cytochrome c oxidase assembly protein subunit 15